MPETKILLAKNYLAAILNAARGENHLFRNFYLLQDGVEKDALRDGELSCAVFVSSVLYLQNSVLEVMGKKRWLSFAHANVGSTEKDMEHGGWYPVREPRPGAVLSWEGVRYKDGETHRHIGFSIGVDRAISNDSNGTGFPREHHWTFEGARKVERIWWHKELEE